MAASGGLSKLGPLLPFLSSVGILDGGGCGAVEGGDEGGCGGRR